MLIISQPYLSNGLAVVMVVVRLSSVVRHRCIVAKRCEIEPRLLLITNKVTYWFSNDINR